MDLNELKNKLNIASEAAPPLTADTMKDPVEDAAETADELPAEETEAEFDPVFSSENDSDFEPEFVPAFESDFEPELAPMIESDSEPETGPYDEPEIKQVVKRQKKKAKKQPEKKDAETHKKVSVFVAAFFFLVIIAADIALIFSHSRVFSENENRMLQQSPSLTGSKLVSGKFMGQFEDFISDQFFLRDNWIQTKLKADLTIGKKESNGVYIGKDGYLFEFTPVPNEEALERSIAAINLFTESNPQVPVVMTIVPNASAVYPDHLPKGAPVRDQLADIEKTKEQLSEKLQFVDLYNDMVVHSDEQIFYKSDHHWTSLGAKYAFEKLAPALGIPNTSSDYEVLTVADDFSGTMASASGSFTTTDKVDIFVAPDLPDYYVEYDGDPGKYPTIYKAEALEQKDKYQVFFGGNYPKISITTTNTTGKNLLLIKDSYANCFVQFLLPYYDKIVIVDPRYYSDDLKKEMDAADITNVLILYNENTFVEDNSLSGVLSEPFTSEQP